MDMEIFYMVLGFAIIYFLIHFVVIQFMRSWKERSAYEKFITIAALVLLMLLLLGIDAGN